MQGIYAGCKPDLNALGNARLQPCRQCLWHCFAPEVRSSHEGPSTRKPANPESGLTLVELIICVAIVAILASAAIPIARFQVKREKERELRRDLWEMRDAIDRYKDAADKGAMQIKADSLGYPPDLETLVNGVEIQDKKVKFLRRIPVDPMTGNHRLGPPLQPGRRRLRLLRRPERLRRPHQEPRHRPRRNKVLHMVAPNSHIPTRLARTSR